MKHIELQFNVASGEVAMLISRTCREPHEIEDETWTSLRDASARLSILAEEMRRMNA